MVTDSNCDSEDLEIWDCEDDEALVDDVAVPSPLLPTFGSTSQGNVHALMMWVISFFLQLQTKYYIPDASINLLVRFFCVFLSVTGRFSTFMKELADVFPTSLLALLSFIKGKIPFTKFVVCRKCHTLYDFDSCHEKIGSQMKSKSCATVSFPDHPHVSRRGPCNCPLLKSVEVRSGKMFLYPHKIFCYTSVKLSLERLFLRPSFYNHCQHWKTRPVSNIRSMMYMMEQYGRNFSLYFLIHLQWALCSILTGSNHTLTQTPP